MTNTCNKNGVYLQNHCDTKRIVKFRLGSNVELHMYRTKWSKFDCSLSQHVVRDQNAVKLVISVSGLSNNNTFSCLPIACLFISFELWAQIANWLVASNAVVRCFHNTWHAAVPIVLELAIYFFTETSHSDFTALFPRMLSSNKSSKRAWNIYYRKYY